MDRIELRERAHAGRALDEKLLSWSQCDVIEADVEYRMKEDQETLRECGIDPTDRDKVWAWVCEDYDLMQINWDDFVENLQEVGGKRKMFEVPVHVDGHNLNWMHSGGSAILDFNDAKDMLHKLVGGYGDCVLAIYAYGEDGLYVNAKHHDCPWEGTKFYLTPIPEAKCPECLETYFGEADSEDIQGFIEQYKVCLACADDKLYDEPELIEKYRAGLARLHEKGVYELSDDTLERIEAAGYPIDGLTDMEYWNSTD